MKIKKTIIVLLLCFLPVAPSFAQKVGEALSAWKEGYMDIHHINTGCGECAYIIFPDGTTMLVDAGENKADNPGMYCPNLMPVVLPANGSWITSKRWHPIRIRSWTMR